MNKNNIFVVIPAFNEQPRLPKVLKELARYIPSSHTVIVDDGSISKLKINSSCWLLRHQINLGKGAAMKTGADFAFKKNANAVIFMDADGQHRPQDLPSFINKINAGYDVVFGCRKFTTEMPLLKQVVNRFSSWLIRFLFQISVSDIPSGFRGLTKKAYDLINWDSYRYGVETEIVARLGKNQKSLRWTEVPIQTVYLDKYKGFTIIEAIKILPETIWWKLS